MRPKRNRGFQKHINANRKIIRYFQKHHLFISVVYDEDDIVNICPSNPWESICISQYRQSWQVPYGLLVDGEPHLYDEFPDGVREFHMRNIAMLTSQPIGWENIYDPQGFTNRWRGESMLARVASLIGIPVIQTFDHQYCSVFEVYNALNIPYMNTVEHHVKYGCYYD